MRRTVSDYLYLDGNNGHRHRRVESVARQEQETSSKPERWPRLVGGSPALEFVNTEIATGGNPDTDVLRSVPEFLAWSSHIQLAVPAMASLTTAGDQSLLADAAALRSAVRSLVEAIAAGHDVDTTALTTLRKAQTEALENAEATLASGRLGWRWDPHPRAVVWMLANSAVDLLREGAVHRLKTCPGCGFVFLDATRNGSRRWCAMEDCGTREKVQRYVSKRARQSST
jgi:predicted RNA-binding Zn ribbon-like protein